jgi:hypothetical protein
MSFKLLLQFCFRVGGGRVGSAVTTCDGPNTHAMSHGAAVIFALTIQKFKRVFSDIHITILSEKVHANDDQLDDTKLPPCIDTQQINLWNWTVLQWNCFESSLS